MQSDSIFFFKFIHPCFLLYLLLFIRPSFYVLSGYFYVAVNLVAVPSVWIRDTAHLRVLKCLSPRPHRTYRKSFFPLVCPIVHPCQVKTVSEKASFQIALQSRDFRKRLLMDLCGWRKNEYVAVLDPRSYPAHEMRRNAHAPIKEGTAFSHCYIFVWTGKNDLKTQREEKSGEKNLHFQTKTDTCERGLSG